MNLLSYLFQQSRPLWLFACISGLLSGLSGAGLIAVISKGISGSGSLSFLFWTFFGLCIVHFFFKCSSAIALLHLTQNAILTLRVTISRKLLSTPFKKLQVLGKPKLLAILTQDIDTFIGASQLLPVAFGNAVIIASCLGYMAWLSWQVFLVFALCLVLGMAGYHFAERHPLQQLSKLRDVVNILYTNFRDLVEGTRELQLNSQRGQTYIKHIIEPGAQQFKQAFLKGMAGYIFVTNGGAILFYIAIGILLFGMPLVLPQRVELLTTFTLILLYLIPPISELMGAIPALRQASISLTQINQLNNDLVLDEPNRVDANAFVSTSPLRLELKGVCHKYPSTTDDGQFMLGPMDLLIGPGEILFVVGGNGSGKTTLALILLGLYEPEQGTIMLNGQLVNNANVDSYRQYFSAVFSDFHLFEQLLGTEEPELAAQAAHYVKAFGVAHKVTVENGKFSTIDLSSGQRKRLALVSSYLEDRPIYLFDEWAADQDPTFKRVFYTELLPQLKKRGKTVIVITHDDAYFSCADRVIKLEDGQLQTEGHARIEAHSSLHFEGERL